MTVTVKSPEEIAKMRVAGQLGAEVLDFITPHVRAGVPRTKSIACATITW